MAALWQAQAPGKEPMRSRAGSGDTEDTEAGAIRGLRAHVGAKDAVVSTEAVNLNIMTIKEKSPSKQSIHALMYYLL